jgi:hypothetical protein
LLDDPKQRYTATKEKSISFGYNSLRKSGKKNITESNQPEENVTVLRKPQVQVPRLNISTITDNSSPQKKISHKIKTTRDRNRKSLMDDYNSGAKTSRSLKKEDDKALTPESPLSDVKSALTARNTHHHQHHHKEDKTPRSAEKPANKSPAKNLHGKHLSLSIDPPPTNSDDTISKQNSMQSNAPNTASKTVNRRSKKNRFSLDIAKFEEIRKRGDFRIEDLFFKSEKISPRGHLKPEEDEGNEETGSGLTPIADLAKDKEKSGRVSKSKDFDGTSDELLKNEKGKRHTRDISFDSDQIRRSNRPKSPQKTPKERKIHTDEKKSIKKRRKEESGYHDIKIEKQIGKIRKWLNTILNEDLPEHRDAFLNILKDGTILCRAVNVLKKGTVKQIHIRPHLETLALENISNFLDACIFSLGMNRMDMFSPNDLLQEEDISKVLSSLLRLVSYYENIEKTQTRDTDSTLLDFVMRDTPVSDDDDSLV